MVQHGRQIQSGGVGVARRRHTSGKPGRRPCAAGGGRGPAGCRPGWPCSRPASPARSPESSATIRVIPSAGRWFRRWAPRTSFAVTDALGQYEIATLNPGPYLLRAHSQRIHRAARADGRDPLERAGRRRRSPCGVPTTAHRCSPQASARSPSSQPATSEPEPVTVLSAPGGSACFPATKDADDHSETAWRLRHARRSVLKDRLSPADLFGDEDGFDASGARRLPGPRGQLSGACRHQLFFRHGIFRPGQPPHDKRLRHAGRTVDGQQPRPRHCLSERRRTRGRPRAIGSCVVRLPTPTSRHGTSPALTRPAKRSVTATTSACLTAPNATQAAIRWHCEMSATAVEMPARCTALTRSPCRARWPSPTVRGTRTMTTSTDAVSSALGSQSH